MENERADAGDGMAEPVSRDLILGRGRGQGKTTFHAHLTTTRIGRLMPQSAKSDVNTHADSSLCSESIKAPPDEGDERDG